MTTLFIANLGARDVALDGERLGSPRADGERLLREWPADAARLTMPLVGPMIRHICDKGDRPDRIILVTTDQPETAPAEHRAKDTVYCGQLARRIVGRLFQRERIGEHQVTLRPITRGNPALYDEMYEFYTAFLGDLKNKDLSGVDRCFVGLDGGTPAGNTSLLLAAVQRFGADCRTLYVENGSAVAHQLDVGPRIHRSMLRKSIADLLDSYQFAAARQLILDLGEPADGAAAVLAEYCQHRLSFDFESAARCVSELFMRERDLRLLIRRAEDEARAMTGDDPDVGALLAETARGLTVLWSNGAYRDYLHRLVGLAESAARHLVKTCLPPLDYSADDEGARRLRMKQIEAEPDLAGYLGAITVGGQPLDYARSNLRTLQHLIDYVVAERPGKPERWRLSAERIAAVAEARDVLKRLGRLSSQRNQSTHAFGGASEESVTATYARAGGHDPRGDVDRLVALVASPAEGEWTVDAIRREILAALDG